MAAVEPDHLTIGLDRLLTSVNDPPMLSSKGDNPIMEMGAALLGLVADARAASVERALRNAADKRRLVNLEEELWGLTEAVRKVEAEEMSCFLPILQRKERRLQALEKEAVEKGVRVKGEDEDGDEEG
jgi:hypothetical protein